MRGLLLINLGTPDSTRPNDVRRYLRQFLMDPDVIDIPWALRALLVGVILIRRPHKSAEAYQKIWTVRGSPLMFHTVDLCEKVRARAVSSQQFAQVEFAMRYGRPSIESRLEALIQNGVRTLTVLPLYPQYSLAATASSVTETRRALAAVCQRLGVDLSAVELRMIQDFYNHPATIALFAHATDQVRKKIDADHVLFSFHGIPERHVKKTDRSYVHCLADKSCCDRIQDVNRNCYRAQSYATAHAIARQMGLQSSAYSVSFQSRLGRTPWIAPYTDVVLDELPKRGVRRLAVVCPSFVADCLETLEEIQIRGREQFMAAGGQDLQLVPSLNASDGWADAVLDLVAAGASTAQVHADLQRTELDGATKS